MILSFLSLGHTLNANRMLEIRQNMYFSIDFLFVLLDIET